MPPPADRLLLVDDDPSAIQVMSRMLADYPHQRFATSGLDAIRLARETAPDLILLDADMPGMTGLDVCDVLRADPVLARVPIIVATSHDAPLLEAAVLERGADDFITKPVVAAQLHARVKARLAQRRRPAPAAPQAAAKPAKLLIVDDDVTAIRVLRHALAGFGEFRFAKTGEEALTLARRMQPDLILLDAHMPDLDGYGVCATLRAEPAFAHVPFVFVTRYTDPRNEQRAFELGAADFIAKPYSPIVVQARVRNLIALKRRAEADVQAARALWRGISDARMADLVACASDAILTHDAAGSVVLANPAACRLFATPLEQLIGARVTALLPLPAENPSTTPARVPVRRADGTALTVEATVSRAGQGADRLTTVMLRDVSARDKLDEQLHARHAAEAALRARSLMISCVAHEIGNPLNAILGFARLMQASGDTLSADHARHLQHILDSSRHLEGLIRDLVELGRLEAGDLPVAVQAIDPADCIAAACAAVGPQAKNAGVAVEAPAHEPAPVLADAARLRQCLTNLLSNAIKYNRRGGWVRIAVRGVLDQVEIVVQDNGRGMNPEQMRHLFEPFNRLGREFDAVEGAGLGMTITRRLVEAMHGDLRVQSQPGNGSCFKLVLPRAPQGLPPAAANPVDP